MKNLIYISFALLMAFLIVSCSKEAGFEDVDESGKGRILKKSINLRLLSDEKIVRSSSDIDAKNLEIINNLKIEFINVNNSVNIGGSGVQNGEVNPVGNISYTYSEMPEIVALPVGEYKIKASYNDDTKADIDYPYYLGELGNSFTIEENQIADNLGQIECVLSNVKVSVKFEESLFNRLSNETVNISYGGYSLNLTKQNQHDGNCAYFPLSSTDNQMTFSFNGVVDGTEITETKTIGDIKKSTHYKVTFKLYDHTPTTGHIGVGGNGVTVEPSITTYVIGGNVPIDDEPIKDGRK